MPCQASWGRRACDDTAWAAGHSRQRTADFLARGEEKWRSGEAFAYAITAEGSVIGGCGLHRRIGPGGLEIGYWLHPRWTGRGLATAAVAALVGEGFSLPGVERLEIHHDAANAPSGAVARRLGFTEVARGPRPEGPCAPGEAGIEVVRRMTARQWRHLAPGPAHEAVRGSVRNGEAPGSGPRLA
ncbi:GNAT family N-acetyltransferase [Streptomyces sp. NPDC008238]